MADKITVMKRTIKLPENNPTLKVVQGLCCSPICKLNKLNIHIFNYNTIIHLPNGGTLNLFIAF